MKVKQEERNNCMQNHSGSFQNFWSVVKSALGNCYNWIKFKYPWAWATFLNSESLIWLILLNFICSIGNMVGYGGITFYGFDLQCYSNIPPKCPRPSSTVFTSPLSQSPLSITSATRKSQFCHKMSRVYLPLTEPLPGFVYMLQMSEFIVICPSCNLFHFTPV